MMQVIGNNTLYNRVTELRLSAMLRAPVTMPP